MTTYYNRHASVVLTLAPLAHRQLFVSPALQLVRLPTASALAQMAITKLALRPALLAATIATHAQIPVFAHLAVALLLGQ